MTENDPANQPESQSTTPQAATPVDAAPVDAAPLDAIPANLENAGFAAAPANTNPYMASSSTATHAGAPHQVGQGGNDGPVSTLIPYKNVPALVGYYLAVFSLIPVLGNILSVFAVGLGIWGLIVKSKLPNAKGSAHAWVAILLGGFCCLVYNGLACAGIITSIVANS